MSSPTILTPRFRVEVIRQGGIDVYIFSMTAEEMTQWCIVERYGEHAEGVNRRLDEDHAHGVANYMLEPDAVMLESISGDLRGNWRVSDGCLVGDEDSRLSLDNGQHRWYAATNLLIAEERERWQWPTVATKGLPYETRMKVFLQQGFAKPIDSRLSLAMRYELALKPGGSKYMTEAEQQAYALILALNTEPNSPLKDLIILEEQDKRPYEGRHRPIGINAVGLWQTFRSLMAKSSPIYSLPIHKRVEIVRNVVWLMSETWPKEWRSKDHALTTARGINAVLKLMVSGKEFQIVVGNDFSYPSLKNALAYAKKYRWHVKDHKNASIREITEGIDKAIGAARRRDASVKLVA
jgi:hypothetical protein